MFAGLNVGNSSSTQQTTQPASSLFLDMSTAAAAAPQLSPMDALAGLQPPSSQHASSSQHQQAASSIMGSSNSAMQHADDLFSGLQAPAAAATGPAGFSADSKGSVEQRHGADLFQGLQAGGSPGPGVGVPSGGDMFGGLSMQASGTSHGQNGLDGLMGASSSRQTQPPVPSAAAAAADLFGGLSLGKDEDIHSTLPSDGLLTVTQSFIVLSCTQPMCIVLCCAVIVVDPVNQMMFTSLFRMRSNSR